ncbi:transcriptional repressor [Acinetobacter sp. C26M]|uniref:transcriptional repressor n=1 Tax=unclassified Acinetobacter TaxID=196816 RepID=UPI0014907DE8|nr:MULTISPECIES: transcriptional repressor [unclassified Acinetobacter]NNP69501.1 hypothetical protein [Acinetobacter sp. Ac_5812]USA45695.1 transcriptional repressor [Acinetobacter sp. C26M]USA49194.1 transcriptional repressor [Acinetobacter sp. C26G]
MNKIDNMQFYMQKLAQYNFRVTIPRIQVLKILFESNTALTAHEIGYISHKSGQYLSQGTIYNTLSVFKKCGLVSYTKFENDKALYSTPFSKN